VLVGEFSASDWLFNQVRERLIPYGLSTIRIEPRHLFVVPFLKMVFTFLTTWWFRDKVISDGVLFSYLDRFVQRWVSEITYGTFCHIPFNPALPDHQQRLGNTFTSLSGKRRIRDSFDIILPKVFPYLSLFVSFICWLFRVAHANFADQGIQNFVFQGSQVQGRVPSGNVLCVVLSRGPSWAEVEGCWPP